MNEPDDGYGDIVPPAPGRRVLALDVGERRIGVAMSDTGGILASPLTTIKATPRPQALAQIAALVRHHAVDDIVVGLPLTMSGDIGPQAQVVQSFAGELETVLGQQVHLFDERLTSIAAEQMMRDLGVKPARRKARIDEVAASIILQDYLDHTRNQERYRSP
ncbi:MAG: Holliday junction resolvase RuvX [Chloroflexaceae bacterium]|nr:Holliday junction resolvase RuvX [Chloroflexaceae bacterium]